MCRHKTDQFWISFEKDQLWNNHTSYPLKVPVFDYCSVMGSKIWSCISQSSRWFSLKYFFHGFSPVPVCACVKTLCVCVLISVAATRSYSRSTGALHTPDAFGAAGEGWVPSFSVLHPPVCLQSFIISSYLCPLSTCFSSFTLSLFMFFVCSRAPSSGNAWFHTLSCHHLANFSFSFGPFPWSTNVFS